MWAINDANDPYNRFKIGMGFAPIGGNGISANKFTGSFDGQGHVISNFSIDRSSLNFIGLFGVVGSGGLVQNIGLEGGSVTGQDVVGALAGRNEGGTVQNTYAAGQVEGDADTGGLIGRMQSTPPIAITIKRPSDNWMMMVKASREHMKR